MESLFSGNFQGVGIAAMLDKRRVSEAMPVCIRVTYARQRWYHPTGVRCTEQGYAAMLHAKGVRSEAAQERQKVWEAYDRLEQAVRRLLKDDSFSLDALKVEIGKASRDRSGKTLYEYWMEKADSYKKYKTRSIYVNSCRSFFRFLGCRLVLESKGVYTLVGAKARITPAAVTQKTVEAWRAWMQDEGLSPSSQSIYLRAIRALMNQLHADSLVKDAPAVKVPASTRRREDYLPVEDIIKIRDYQGPHRKWADWWLILYTCNGANMADLATLTWEDEYFFQNELTFVRHKTESRSPQRVYIPVIPELQDLLSRHASEPQRGVRVFPQILLSAETEQQISMRIADVNRMVGSGIKRVCAALGIRPVSASTARNSYITTLTHHEVSNTFIDDMVGHVSDKSVLRGYQGIFSAKKRAKYNNLLFVVPEE